MNKGLSGAPAPVVAEGQHGESARGAVTTFLSFRLPGPLTEPAVCLSTQRALHGC